MRTASHSTILLTSLKFQLLNHQNEHPHTLHALSEHKWKHQMPPATLTSPLLHKGHFNYPGTSATPFRCATSSCGGVKETGKINPCALKILLIRQEMKPLGGWNTGEGLEWGIIVWAPKYFFFWPRSHNKLMATPQALQHSEVICFCTATLDFLLGLLAKIKW